MPTNDKQSYIMTNYNEFLDQYKKFESIESNIFPKFRKQAKLANNDQKITKFPNCFVTALVKNNNKF